MIGTSVRGKGGDAYMAQWLMLLRFLADLKPETACKVRHDNAAEFYKPRKDEIDADNLDAIHSRVHARASFASTALKGAPGSLTRGAGPSVRHAIMEHSDSLHHDDDDDAPKDLGKPVAEKNRSLAKGEIKHETIDVHMHLLDFLHKSSGTQSALAAMDGTGVQKAVLLGMPCCKKWSCDEPEKPL